MERCDKFPVYISRKTGRICIANPNVEFSHPLYFNPDIDGPMKYYLSETTDDNTLTTKSEILGPDVSNQTDLDLVKCFIPYTMKLLVQELESIGISMKFKIKEENSGLLAGKEIKWEDITTEQSGGSSDFDNETSELSIEKQNNDEENNNEEESEEIDFKDKNNDDNDEDEESIMKEDDEDEDEDEDENRMMEDDEDEDEDENRMMEDDEDEDEDEESILKDDEEDDDENYEEEDEESKMSQISDKISTSFYDKQMLINNQNLKGARYDIYRKL